MTYWVYEDDPTNRTRTHMATCNRCNDGRGTRARVFQIIGGTAHSEPNGKPLTAR